MAMLGATAIWGFAPPIIKYTLAYIPPVSFLFYRLLIVCLILFPFIYLELRRQNVGLRDFPALAVSGLLSQASLIVLFYGLKYTTSLEVAVIGIISPLLMVAAGHFFFNDKVNKYIEAGLIITSFGTLVLALGPILDSNISVASRNARLMGNTLIVIYNLIWVADVLWAKRIRGENSHKVNEVAKFLSIPVPRKKYSSQLITGITFYVGLACIMPFYLLESAGKLGSNGFSILHLTTVGWLGLLYMALLSSIVAYTLFDWSLKYLKITDTVIFSYISPIFTLPAAFLILGEVPTSDVILGVIIVSAGIVVAEHKKS